MKTHLFKRGIAGLLSLVICLSAFIGLGTTTAFAAGEQAEVYLISFPRSGDANLDYSGTWGHPELRFMNGWFLGASNYTIIRALHSYDGNICYCIEPGTPQETGDSYTSKDETFWDNLPSDFNGTISPYDIKLFIGRIMQYGYTGPISTSWRSQNPADAATLAEAMAIQVLIWETVVGERDEDFDYVSPGSYDAVKGVISTAHPLYDLFCDYYDSIEASVQRHSAIPSFMSKNPNRAQSVELEWDGSSYTATLTDHNRVLSDYIFSANEDGISFSVNGNKLVITAATAPSDSVRITANKTGSTRRGIITWTDGRYAPGGGIQDVVSYAQKVNDPVQAFLNLKVSYGSAKIVKTSEDGKVDNLTFTVTGNGVNQTVKTNSKGEIQIDNLMPGVYTVTEMDYDKYEPQESRRVTVVSGQVSTVNFNNKLKRGDLQVIKSSEDNLNEGVTFHLYGTSLSGVAVDEYAVTDANGVATFEAVLISGSTPYTVEEVDTAVRYVVPEAQSAPINWNEVTSRSFLNILKKFSVTVTKSDAETGTAQGDASLAGAVYGIYKGETLVDTYTTDKNGQFVTKEYICDNDWTVREITPSEGYLLDTTVHKVGAEPQLYTVEHNQTANDVTEQVAKGNIAIIKHTDNGDTQIETPENGAEFAVYLKAAGSYEVAEDKATGANAIIQEKYITISVCKKNVEEARNYFARVGADLIAHFGRLGSKCVELEPDERLRIFHDFYRAGEETEFRFDIKETRRKGHDFKDFICPDSMEFTGDYFKIGERYGRVLFLREYASYIKDSMVAEMTDLNRNLMMSIDVIPVPTDEAVREAESRLLGVETNATNWQRRQNANNNFSAQLPYDIEQQRKEMKEFLDDLTTRDQRMMFAVLTMVHTADTKEQLDNDTEALLTTARKHLCQFGILKFQQLDGLNTAMPFGVRKIESFRTLTTESLAVFIPFRVQDICHTNGVYYGQNVISKNMIIADRRQLLNGNEFILGVSGGGKSFTAKGEVINQVLAGNADIIIIDPEREYSPLVRALGGEIINISATSPTHINAMDMNREYGDGANPVILKSEFIMSLCEQLIGGNNLGAVQKSIIDRCTASVYRTYQQNNYTGEVPTLQDFRAELLKQSEPEAQEIALAIELFTNGSLNTFAKKTNVDTDNRLICYDILDLGKQLMPIGMLVVLDSILNRITQNRAKGKNTFIFIDEIYLLFQHEYSANFLFTLWKRVRKYGAYATGITQNVDDLLQSHTARTMLANSEFIVMLNQASTDRLELAKLLNISDTQLSYITNVDAGHGLIKVGSSLVPFANKFPKNTKLYKLMTTKPGEGAQPSSYSLKPAMK